MSRIVLFSTDTCFMAAVIVVQCIYFDCELEGQNKIRLISLSKNLLGSGCRKQTAFLVLKESTDSMPPKWFLTTG